MRPSLLPPVLLAAALALPGARPAAAERARPAAGAAARADAPRDPSAEALVRATAALGRDRRGPEGLAAVAALADLEDEAPDLGRLAAVYGRAADDPATHPEVRAALVLRLSALERARGNLRRSEAHLRRLGFVEGWQLVGPFDDEGKRGFATAYPPEREASRPELTARHSGKVREVGWRALPADGQSQGFVHLGAALRPSREVVGYALAIVNAPRDERVQLWFGASGATKVWVNGALALSDPTYHLARPDQRAAVVSLRRGANRILVKLCQQDGRMGFYLRLADGRGEGRSFPSADPAAPAAIPGPAPVALPDAVSALERVAATARGHAAGPAQAALSAVLAYRAAGDRDERRAASAAAGAARLLPRDVDAQIAAAALEEDHGARRVLLDGALALAPDDPRALRAVAQDELDQGRPQAAARLLQRAVAAAPDWAEVQVALAEALDRSGLSARAALFAEETARRFPTTPAAVRAGARAAGQIGRIRDAAARERTLLALRLDDGAARASLVQHLLQLGDAPGAAALLAEGLRLDPSDQPQRLAEADLLAANGQPEAAEAGYARALELCPEDPEAWERRGRARLTAGRARDAQGDLARALELRPQSTGLKELVRSLSPAERFEAPYVLDARSLATAPLTAPATAGGADAVVLGDLKVTRVLPSGLSSTYTQRLVKVLTSRGADAFRRQGLAWTPDRQEVRVERARIWKPDGSVVESHEEQETSASEPWYRLYYDVVARTVSFPALVPGDVVEVAWRVDDTAGENLLSDYFGDVTYVDEGQPKARFDYVLIVPEARAIHSSAPPGVAHAERKLAGGLVEHRFTARELPRLVPEPSMPGQAEVARYVHVSTYQSWDEVNRFYWRLIRDQLRSGPELKAVAERIAASVRAGGGKAGAAPPGDRESRAALVRAAYAFVVTQTRYVGLEFGIHGFKPYRVDQVLSRRFGDCKDKASLLHALLGELGIDSRLVLLRMRRMGRLPERPASLAVFNHAIVYVPELDLWLDGTASYSGSRELPQEDRGATVLVVNPDGPPRFGTIPDATPEDNRLAVELAATLQPDGAAAAEGSWRIQGVDAPGYRRAYGIASERRAGLEQALNRSFPGVKVERERLSDLSRLEEDVVVGFSLAVPRYAQRDGDGLRFLPFGSVRGYAESYAPLSVRNHDVDLGSPREVTFTCRTALPPGWRLVEVPEPVEGSGPAARFSVRYRSEAGALVAEGRVALTASRVAARDYAAFRGLMVEVDRAFSRRVRVAPGVKVAGAEGER